MLSPARRRVAPPLPRHRTRAVVTDSMEYLERGGVCVAARVRGGEWDHDHPILGCELHELVVAEDSVRLAPFSGRVGARVVAELPAGLIMTAHVRAVLSAC